jgi:serine/threonine protein kinase
MVIYEANVTLLLHEIRLKKKEIKMDDNTFGQDQKKKGFAKIYSFGQHQECNFMAMELMGPSLSDLFQFCGWRFSLKTTIMLAYQLIERFEQMHNRNFIHRDIKPDNFLMGLGDNSNLCHIVDMGLAKYFVDPQTKKHISHITGKSLTGTARYVSINSHNGEELSRRDDFEAIGYVLVYFYTGSLPW